MARHRRYGIGALISASVAAQYYDTHVGPLYARLSELHDEANDLLVGRDAAFQRLNGWQAQVEQLDAQLSALQDENRAEWERAALALEAAVPTSLKRGQNMALAVGFGALTGVVTAGTLRIRRKPKALAYGAGAGFIGMALLYTALATGVFSGK